MARKNVSLHRHYPHQVHRVCSQPPSGSTPAFAAKLYKKIGNGKRMRRSRYKLSVVAVSEYVAEADVEEAATAVVHEGVLALQRELEC